MNNETQTIYRFKTEQVTDAATLAKLFSMLLVTLIQSIQQQPINPLDDLEIDDSIFDKLPDDLKQYFEQKS